MTALQALPQTKCDADLLIVRLCLRNSEWSLREAKAALLGFLDIRMYCLTSIMFARRRQPARGLILFHDISDTTTSILILQT